MILINAHKLMGNKWTEIAKRLPGRTENTIKNHWYAVKRRKLTNERKSPVSSRYTKSCTLLQNYIRSLAKNPSAEPSPNVVASVNNPKGILFDQNSVSVSPVPTPNVVASGDDHQNSVSVSSVPTPNVVASGDDPKGILFDQNSVSVSLVPTPNVVASGDDHQNSVSVSPVPTLNVVASGDDPKGILFPQMLVSAGPNTSPEDKQNLIEKEELKDYPNQTIINTGVSSSDCQALDTDVDSDDRSDLLFDVDIKEIEHIMDEMETL